MRNVDLPTFLILSLHLQCNTTLLKGERHTLKERITNYILFS